MMNPLPQPTKAESLNDHPPNDDTHAPVEEQIKAWQRKDGKVPGYYGADELRKRVKKVEAAIAALSRLEFGDSAGHPFRGNQYTGGEGGGPVDISTDVRLHNGRVGTVYNVTDKRTGQTTTHTSEHAARRRAAEVAKRPPRWEPGLGVNSKHGYGTNHSDAEHNSRQDLRRWQEEAKAGAHG